MPVDGRASWSAAANLPDFHGGLDVVLSGVELLHVFFEIPADAGQAAIPAALHPTIPCALYASFLRCAESPWGPFTLAEVRLSARAREKPRALLVHAALDGSTDVAAAMGAAWALQTLPARVSLERWYDRIEGEVVVDGVPVLRAGLGDPEPIPGASLQYGPAANPALVAGRPTIVLVDSVFEMSDDRQRGHPRFPVFEADWWGVPDIRVTTPIGAYYTNGDLHLPAPRTVLDPDMPAAAGVFALP